MLGANPNTTESYSQVGWPIAPDRSQPTAAYNMNLQPMKDILRIHIFSSEPPDVVGWRDDISSHRNRRWQSDSKVTSV